METVRDTGSRGEPTTPISVVHVDDDSAFLSATGAFLGTHAADIEVESFTDPNAVLDRLEDGDVDCVVSDYAMPEMDGLAVLAAVRERGLELPFVLYTGRGSEAIASEAIAAGVTEYVRKGVGTSHYDLLVNRVRNAVRTHRAQRRAKRLEHVAGVIRATNQALLRAKSREELFTDATVTLANAEPYVAAWIGTLDPGPRMEPQSWAGPVEPRESAITALVDEATTTGSFQVEHQVSCESVAVDAPEIDSEDTCSVAALPLVAGEECFGVLVVYGADADAFDADERDLLEEVAEDIGFAVDAITLREQLEKRATEIELLTRVLRHDVRNDIQVISGWCTLLAADASATQRAPIEKIAATSHHIEELTETAREIVEALAANGDHPLKPVDTICVLEAEIQKVRELTDIERIPLETDADEATVLANEMLATVFRNVLNNAVQHADDPRIEATVTERDGRVVVRIADDGPGIPASRREAVFSKGERGVDSRGTGMGLYLVETLVEQYGGTTRIEDNDPGVAVVVELPTI